MNQAVQPASGEAALAALRDELARAGANAQSVQPTLRQLMGVSDTSLFNDEIVARIRAMLRHLSAELIEADPGQAPDRRHGEALSQALMDQPAILSHAHSVALEWQLTERLRATLHLDPVTPPLIDDLLVAGSDTPTFGLARAFVSAQARWCHSQRRMQWSVSELPVSERTSVWAVLRRWQGADAHSFNHPDVDDSAARPSRWDAAANLITCLPGGLHTALELGYAGPALFLSALALATGQGRDSAVLLTSGSQAARLGLSLRAAGLEPHAIERQFLALHSTLLPPDELNRIDAHRATAMLADAQTSQCQP